MGLKIGGQVEKVNGKELSYSEFVERYFVKNQPVVLTGLMDDWRACKDWVFEEHGRPNLSFFSTHFGNSRVQVAECATRDFTDHKRVDMSVLEFIDHWLQLYSNDCSNSSINECFDNSLLYLKDWHFVKEYPEYLAYKIPLFFCDDWLNLYLNKYHMHTMDSDFDQGRNEISCSDYRFVYMGAKGTWTPLHADVFRSYSWSSNVCGKKQWYFLHPSQHHLVFDRNMKNSVYDILGEVSETKFPGFSKAIWWECTQNQNEIIFVPSGWYHQVHNLEDTISINHNWFNAYNLNWVWDLLLKDYNEAKEYIEDIKDICDDFEQLCQRNLAANTGMNFFDFFIFMVRFSLANLVQLYHLTSNCDNVLWSSSNSARHIVFNLEAIRSIALKMESTGLMENHRNRVNLLKTIEDPAFMELCTALERTYKIIHEKCEVGHDMKQGLANYLDLDCIASSAHVSSPKDLVKCIDDAITKLRSITVSIKDVES